MVLHIALLPHKSFVYLFRKECTGMPQQSVTGSSSQLTVEEVEEPVLCGRTKLF